MSAAAFVALATFTVLAHGAESLPSALATLKKVGHQAAGNRAATQAWAVVAASDASQLPALLTALEDAGPLPANYLRSAIDTVAERTLANGKQLPRDELERYALDTARAPRSRRLAFEWLAKIDPTAKDRLVPGFLDDPSLEMRRDAVARLTVEGSALVEKAGDNEKQRAEGIATLERAFAASRDLDQIEALDKELTKLKVNADLPRHFGFVTTWHLIGPFDNRDGIGFDAVYPPEEKVDFKAEHTGKKGLVAWKTYETADRHGKVDLNQALGKDMGCVAYAAVEFYSTREREADLRLGTACASKVWLNDKQLSRHRVYHTGGSIDQYSSSATLQQGRNVILLKICQNEQTQSWAQDWDFQFRVCDKIGTAVLSTQVLDDKQARH